MRKFALLLTLCLVAFCSFSQEIKEVTFKSEIQEVTVFLSGAQVLKEKTSLLNANKNIGGTQNGSSLTELKRAMDFYDAELMKIKAEELKIQATIQKENSEMNKLRNQISAMQASSNESTSEIRIRVKADRAGSANFEINYLVANAGWYPKYDVRVKNVSSPLSLTYKAEVYQNTGVDWKDVKLRFSNGNPNQSGQIPDLEKWELNFARLTSFNPRTQTFGSVSGFITSATDGQSLPGANILVTGTTIGTVSDMEGNYSLTLPSGTSQLSAFYVGFQPSDVNINSSRVNISLQEDTQALEEMVTVGNALKGKAEGMEVSARERRMSAPQMKVELAYSIATTVIENHTTVEIEVAEPYSIKSNGEKTLVDLKNFQVDASYRYSVVPKLVDDTFLIAEIPDWSQYSLLQGESNLCFEDGFVGRSILDGSSLQDTLEISMGRDRSIVIKREKNDQFSKKRAIGSNITEIREFNPGCSY